MMRLGSVLPWLTLVASGCASTSWSIDRSARAITAVTAVTVAPIEVAGDADPKVADDRLAGLVESMRARGYDVRFDDAPGVPLLKLRVSGKLVTDAQMHAPDDRFQRIHNDLTYRYVAYHVEVELADGAHIVAMGAADSNQDPAPALRVLAARLFSDVPPTRAATIASR